MMRRALDVESVAFVCVNMRQWNRAEVNATRCQDDDMQGLASAILDGRGVGYAVGLERPIAVLGWKPVGPRVAETYMVATAEFERIARPLTKLVRQALVPECYDHGMLRCQATTMDGNPHTPAWMAAMGAEHEGVLRRYGKAGQDFHLWRFDPPARYARSVH